MATFDFKKSSSFYDELLGADANGSPKSKEDINMNCLVEIENQPFNPYSPEQLKLLSEDIKLNGLMSPLIVHKLNGSMTYEILAGRNRFNACKLLDFKTIPCIVKEDLSKAQRDLILVNSNLMQRQSLLPSERAKAYKMQQEAYKELGVKFESQESQATVYKYLRLNDLCCELLEKVDTGELQFTIGYELSGFELATQNALIDYLYDEPKTKITTAFLDQLCAQEGLGKVDVNTIEDIVKSGKKEKEDAKANKLKTEKLVVNMAEFRSPIKNWEGDKLKKFILTHEFDFWEIYQKNNLQNN